MNDKPTVLYIEDNTDNQRLVKRILEARGYCVLLSETGPDGIALAREAAPSLILVDISIPGLDGYETTTRLRGMRHLRGAPIVAITADSRAGTRERSLVAGCDGYITKPIDPRRLPDQLEEFMNGKREAPPQAIETTMLREYNLKLVERLERQVRELSAANAELQVEIHPTAVFLGDTLGLEQAIRNVLDNALKFTPRQGRVRVTLNDETSRVILRVEDTGIGIPAEAQEKIFLPFYQVDTSLARQHPGAGMGLAIVKHIIEAHDGQVTVRSAPGAGSTFTLVLPRT